MKNTRLFNNKDLKPFTSLLIILCTLFITAFSKIVLRRLSYALYQVNKTFDKAQDEYYSNVKVYGKLTQTEQLDRLAKKHLLNKKKKGQLIQVIDGKAFVVD